MTDTVSIISKDSSSQPSTSNEQEKPPPTSPLPSTSKNTESTPPSKDDPPPRETFHCTLCGLTELYDYKGKEPPFVNGICFTENCYVMRDAFAPPLFRIRSKPEYFIVLGAHCRLCDTVVCKGRNCSVYYDSTFCRHCALSHLEIFPDEIREKTRNGFMAAG